MTERNILPDATQQFSGQPLTENVDFQYETQGGAQDLLAQLELGWQAHGDAFAVDFNGLRCAVLSHPRDIRRVFTDGSFREKGPMYEGVRRVIGDGILTSSGEKWRSNHRLITPAFHRQHVVDMVCTIAGVGKEYVDDLQARSEDGLVVDLQEEMTKLTLNTLGAVILGRNAEALHDLSYGDLKATFSLASKVGEGMDEGTKTQHESIAGRLHDLTDRLIRSARLQEPDGTLLSMLAHSRDTETHQYMDNQAIRDELLTIMFAGHETTALTLTWLFQLTQGHPDIRVQMQQEAQETLSGEEPTMDDLSRLTTIRQTIDEVLRLRPPVPITARSVGEAVTVGGINVGPNEGVLPFIWGAHRHEEFWTTPDTFDPTRFSPENSKGRDKWSYLPFAAGSRICIGQSFALTELAIHSALLAEAMDIQVVDKEISPKVSMTLRPSSPIYAQVKPLR